MVSKSDTTVDASHSENLYNAYGGWEKKIVYFEGLHNETRNETYVNSVFSFIKGRI